MISRSHLSLRRFGRLWRHGVITLVAFYFGGCGVSPRTETPLPSIPQALDGARSQTLLVMLPGRGDRAESFEKAGFLNRVSEQPFDVVAVDAHFGYYKERSLVAHLHDDIIMPAKQNGYKNIWLLGVSMGGMGSLLYAEQHPDFVDGIILLAPYLGDPGIVAEIQSAGGLNAWSDEESQFSKHEIAIWRWLKESRRDENPVPVYLGFGKSDRFAGNYGALQSSVAGIEVFTEDGGHKWTVWSRLWNRISTQLSIDGK